MNERHPLQAYRAKHDLTQDELGLLLQVSGMSISRWERGALLPHRSQWVKIRAVTGLTMSDFAPFVSEVAA